jgi:hypothetical protein
MYKHSWWERLRERDHLEDLDINVQIKIQSILTQKGSYGMVWVRHITTHKPKHIAKR